jgi:hypothetical protein
MRRRAATLLVAGTLMAAVPSIGSCSSAQSHYTVNSVAYLHDGQNLVFRGGGCAFVALPGAGGADNRGPQVGDFNVTEGPDGDAYLVRVFSDQELLALRRYDEAMLASGRVDEFDVTTHARAVYTLRYWGGPCSALAVAATE